ncbi:MAG: adenylosuccinate synthase [Alphaproteobacteria bacterium]|nr:adenylosuccinate synthase [Alphaproteobacteria bacterium]
MPVTAIVGAQWGDEGKGRIVDYLAQRADLVLRFQGGDNAGHTVVNDFGTFKLHLIPSGIFNPDTTCVIGTGTTVNPDALLRELAEVESAGVSTENLLLSERAHIVMPYHPMLDGLQEQARSGDQRIGTTKKGIGPTYADKAARRGLRLGDLKYPDWFKERLEPVLAKRNATLAEYGEPPISLDAMMDKAEDWRKRLGDRIVDTLPIVRQALTENRRVLLEGQLGVMRDLDWGIYPFVTSSNPISGGACAGAGLPPTAIKNIIGVVKVYSTAVGAGPFPVEDLGPQGEKLREIGNEYGATTGRPRRCGWFDGVAIRYASWINGFTGLAVTKLDVLDHFEEIKICTGYRVGEKVLDYVPDTPLLRHVEPVYETWEGWMQSTRGVRNWDDLPKAARAYLHRLSELADAPIRYVSVGAEREELIPIPTPWP